MSTKTKWEQAEAKVAKLTMDLGESNSENIRLMNEIEHLKQKHQEDCDLFETEKHDLLDNNAQLKETIE